MAFIAVIFTQKWYIWEEGEKKGFADIIDPETLKNENNFFTTLQNQIAQIQWSGKRFQGKNAKVHPISAVRWRADNKKRKRI